MNSQLKSKTGATLLALPSATMLLLLSIVPLIMLTVFSFVDGNIEPQGIAGFTINNFATMFSSESFYKLMGKSIKIALLVTTVCIIISYPAAWGIAKVIHESKRNLMIMIAIVPFFTSQLLLLYAIMVLLQANGVIMGPLGFLGLADPESSILYTTRAVILILIYEYLPYMILCLYSSMEKIDDNVIQASHSLGAGRIRTFINVVFPQSIPGLLAGILLVFVPVAGSFVEPTIAGGPRGMMIGSLINSQFTVVLNMGYGAALSFMFLIIMSAAIFLINLLAGRANIMIGGE